MSFKELIEMLLSTIKKGSHSEAVASIISWSSKEYSLYVFDVETYQNCLENIYLLDKKIYSKFSRKTIFEYINNKIPLLIEKNDTIESSNQIIFFEHFFAIKPVNLTILAPISGIRLGNEKENFNLSIFKFGYLKNLQFPIANENGMYISVDVKNIYDKNIAIEIAENAFLDFIRLIVFISGKQDHSISISTGLPLCPDVSYEKMYVNTTSYQILDESGNIYSSNILNKFIEKIPVDNKFFYENSDFNKLWVMLEKKLYNKKMNEMEKRLINAALAQGESALTLSKKNSILYTCISLEILFSHDARALFQPSIGDKLAKIFPFIVAQDKDSRQKTAQTVKHVYGMRSAIVHGGDKLLDNTNIFINILMRAAISQLLNNDKFKTIKSIDQLYKMLDEAQNSY